MKLDELKRSWETRIYKLTEQLYSLQDDSCESKLIRDEREVLIKCLDELNKVEL